MNKKKFLFLFFFIGIFDIKNIKNNFIFFHNFYKFLKNNSKSFLEIYKNKIKNLPKKFKSPDYKEKNYFYFFKKRTENNLKNSNLINEKLNKFLYGENYYKDKKKQPFFLQAINNKINININFSENNQKETLSKNFYKKAFSVSLFVNFLQFLYNNF